MNPSPEIALSREDSGRLTLIDGFRFLAAASVLLFHYCFRGQFGFTYASLDPLGGLFHYGFLGVPLFFMISGFVITLSAEGRSGTTFIASRISRLYPAFWACCIFVWILSTTLGSPRMQVGPKDLLLNLTMFPYQVGAKPVCGVYWTLAEEAKFYALTWAMVSCGQFVRFHWFLWAWCGVSALAIVVKIPHVESALALQWAPWFIAGAAFYMIRTRGHNIRWSPLLVASLPLCVHSAVRQTNFFSSLFGIYLPILPSVFITLAFFVMFISLLFLRNAPPMRALPYLGALTYPLYLLHEYVGYIIINRLQQSLLVATLAAIFCSLALAALVVRFVERPFAKRFRSWLLIVFEKLRRGLVK